VDTLDLYVSNSTAANAVTVTQLTSGMSGTDATAFAANYTAKVTSGSEVNYIKNVEAVNVQIWNDANSNGQKDWGNNEVTAGKYINLTVNVSENISPSQFTLGNVTGTFMSETVGLEHRLCPLSPRHWPPA
jgi:hypothetical protein